MRPKGLAAKDERLHDQLGISAEVLIRPTRADEAA
jgi:hypothetical protein